MKFKNIFNAFKKSSKNKIEADESYCYSNIVWNDPNNLVILLSFTKDYFEQIIDIQDAINYPNDGLISKIIYSSYDKEEVLEKDEFGNSLTQLISYKRYYMLIGGDPEAWQTLYKNIHDLGNEALSKISDEIINNCDKVDFEDLVDDGILFNFANKYEYDPIVITDHYSYADPKIMLSRLPNGFTGRDIIKFIRIRADFNGDITWYNGLNKIYDISFMNNKEFKNYELYPLYDALFKSPTVEKLSILLEPLYKQPDDDSIPGDVSDESLDAIFREHYERFSAIADDNTHYEDIDEELDNIIEEDEK